MIFLCLYSVRVKWLRALKRDIRCLSEGTARPQNWIIECARNALPISRYLIAVHFTRVPAVQIDAINDLTASSWHHMPRALSICPLLFECVFRIITDVHDLTEKRCTSNDRWVEQSWYRREAAGRSCSHRLRPAV